MQSHEAPPSLTPGFFPLISATRTRVFSPATFDGFCYFWVILSSFISLFLICYTNTHKHLRDLPFFPSASHHGFYWKSSLYYCEFYQLEIQTIKKKWFQAARWPLSTSVKCCIYALNFKFLFFFTLFSCTCCFM